MRFLRLFAVACMMVPVFLPVGRGNAMVLLEKDAALKEMFPDAEKVSEEVKVLDSNTAAALKQQLGGSLVHFQTGSQSGEVKEKLQYTFYFAAKGGQKNEVAVVEEQPGKWGPVTFIIALDARTAKVKNLAVMSYEEKRGRPIARHNFLDQFIGKGSGDKLAVRKDIRGITGATISSECTCFAVKKVAMLYEMLYLKKGK
jgi:Na+-translocating ferredoxin:NAD+ oxidoreductase RnfG subunit